MLISASELTVPVLLLQILIPSDPCSDATHEERMVVFDHGEDFFSASNSGLMIVHAASGH